MTDTAGRASSHTGARIRDRRLALDLKQADLAARSGISASYLNLIEHNKRRIGGKLLIDIARALGLEPAALSEGPEAALFEALQSAAAGLGRLDPPPETDRIDALNGRFPGWAAAIAALQRQIASLEAQNDALRDRLSHDQVLAEAMHEVLSTASAIRSTAAILVEDASLDPQWRNRFHRNLHEEAERLSTRALALSKHFEAEESRRARPAAPPEEAVEMLFDLAGHHFPAIETGASGAIAGILADAEGLEDPAARAMAELALVAYANDAARLPMDEFAKAARASDFRPEPLYALASGDVALVLRRLACLPPGTGAPAFGLAVCDASGALLSRKRHPLFSVPRFATGCPLWPLYRALSRPLAPESARLVLPDGIALDTWSVSQPVGHLPGGAPILNATMLLRSAPAEETGGASGRSGYVSCGRSTCPVCSLAAPDAGQPPED